MVPDLIRKTQGISNAVPSQGLNLPSVRSFRSWQNHELLTVVSNSWGAICCAAARAKQKSNPMCTVLCVFLKISLFVALLLFPFTPGCWLFLSVAARALLELVSTPSSPQCDIHSITIEPSICQALPLLSRKQWEAQRRDKFTSASVLLLSS